MNQISAVVICCNEEAKIERALQSARGVADEIVIVDSGSVDRTLEICRRYTDQIYRKAWTGYRQQKQFATDRAHYDWILSLDADEELTPHLQDELLRWKCSEADERAGYLIARRTFFMGRWIRYTSWYPDWQLRLFNRTSGSWEGGRVHESFRTPGAKGQLKGHLNHYTYTNLSEFILQLDRFSTLAAADLNDRGKRATVLHMLFDPPLVFLKNYIWRLGLLDGLQGFIVSVISSVSTLFKYLKLWEMQHLRQEDRKL